jgi:glucose/mannose transport system substrate-binding protein
MIERTRAMSRILTVTALWVGFFLPLAGCGEDDARPPDQRREPLVEVFTWWLAPGEAEAMQALIHAHVARHPEARIFNTASKSALVLQDRLEQRLGLRDPPDLLQVTNRELALMESRHPGSLEYLDDLFDAQGLRRVIFPEALAQVVQAGHVVAMPVNLHRENGLFYNKALFEAQHLSPPTTIDELLSVCRKLKAAGVTPIATARQGWILRMMLSSLVSGTMGATAYRNYFTHASATGLTQLRAAIDLLAEILQNYINPDAGEEGFGWTNAAQTLFNGDAAMFFHGDWVRGYLIQLGWRPGIDFGVVAAPGAPDLFVYLADGLAIPKGARNIEGARELLATAASPAGQVAFNRLKGSSPIRADVPKGALDPLGQATLEDFEKARVRMRSPNPVQLDDAVMKFSADWNADALLQALVDSRLENEFPATSNDVGRRFACDARPGVGATACQIAPILDRIQSTMPHRSLMTNFDHVLRTRIKEDPPQVLMWFRTDDS